MGSLLIEGLAQLATDYPLFKDAEVQTRLERYIAQVELYNPALGLVSVRDRDELIVRHILDSLAPLALLCGVLPGGVPRIADAGSGAGLPGLPLAIALPKVNLTLLERMGRRVSFLHTAVLACGITNVDIEQTDVERALPGRFDLVSFRAFRPLDPAMLKALFRLLAPGGKLAAYKGRSEKITEEMAGIEELVGSWTCHEISVPFLEEERHLVLIQAPLTQKD